MKDRWNLFLDDYRHPPGFSREWVVARSYKEAVDLLETDGCPDFISFDHDLSDVHYQHLEGTIPYDTFTEKTGYHFAKWLIEKDMDANGKFIPQGFRFAVHSMNPVGALNIKHLMTNYLNSRHLNA